MYKHAPELTDILDQDQVTTGGRSGIECIVRQLVVARDYFFPFFQG